jgi:molecular chaperone HtpG
MAEKQKTKKQKPSAENFEFQSEVKQLLNILVYSLYQHKDIFLRELISNAVDALNKVKFETLIKPDLDDKDLDLKIDISFDSKKKKIIVEDTGIGMTKQELIDNLGTIAHSGTVEFLKRMSGKKGQKETAELIGKFGVGFYSSFMVADEIQVHTKSFQKGSKGQVWKSKGDNTYTIEEKTKKNRGTRIELSLKKEEKEFLDKFRLKSIINKHSRFVPFPIFLESEEIESMAAIWSQPKTNLKEKDYNEFYKFFENAPDDPETYIHLSSDAPVQFNSIMYVPKTNFEILGFMKTEPGVDLYSSKVLIQKGSKDIMPEYLRFIKGLIDSEDIPLNISRETIQKDNKIVKIRKHIIKKLLDHFSSLKSKDRDKYLNIWKNFYRNFKEGVISDFENKTKIAPLLFFHSSKTKKDEYTDLVEYVKGMAKDQKEIYYVAGKDIDALDKHPALEAFKKKEIEVLYLVDPIDEFVVEHLREFEGKTFKMAETADIKLEDKDKKEDKKEKDYLKDAENFVGYLKTIYGEKVKDVKISKRLVESPCVLVNPGDGPSVQMEMIMKMHNKEYGFSKKILEINPENNLIKEMIRIHKGKPDSAELKTLSFQLLDNMMLRAGITEDIENIIPRIQDIMLQAAKQTT